MFWYGIADGKYVETGHMIAQIKATLCQRAGTCYDGCTHTDAPIVMQQEYLDVWNGYNIYKTYYWILVQ